MQTHVCAELLSVWGKNTGCVGLWAVARAGARMSPGRGYAVERCFSFLKLCLKSNSEVRMTCCMLGTAVETSSKKIRQIASGALTCLHHSAAQLSCALSVAVSTLQLRVAADAAARDRVQPRHHPDAFGLAGPSSPGSSHAHRHWASDVPWSIPYRKRLGHRPACRSARALRSHLFHRCRLEETACGALLLTERS